MPLSMLLCCTVGCPSTSRAGTGTAVSLSDQKINVVGRRSDGYMFVVRRLAAALHFPCGLGVAEGKTSLSTSSDDSVRQHTKMLHGCQVQSTEQPAVVAFFSSPA